MRKYDLLDCSRGGGYVWAWIVQQGLIMNRQEFEKLSFSERLELAEHLQNLREHPSLHPDELAFKDELEAIEKELGSLFPH